MKRVTKILTVLLCACLCAGGAIFSVKGSAKNSRPKTKIVPVNNHRSKRAGWILV